jgi:hypothetical protein
MSILRLSASADTTIVNAFRADSLTRAIYSNTGNSDALEVFSVYYKTQEGAEEPQLSRLLIKFPLEKINNLREEGKLPNSGSVSFYLKLSNIKHAFEVPEKFSVIVAPISGSDWQEGYGFDLEGYADLGYNGTNGEGANWTYASSSRGWSTAGGDYYPDKAKSFYFETGLEDLEVDVTDSVEEQLASTIPNYGFIIALSGAFEQPEYNKSFYTKRFSSRSSEYFFKRPCIEARWGTEFTDDRPDFYFYSPNAETEDNTQDLYFYNKINGTLKDLPSGVVPNVVFKNETNTNIGSAVSQKISTGVYRCSVILTGSQDSTINDYWVSGSTVFYKGEIDAKVRTFDEIDSPTYVLNITNLKSSYTQDELIKFKIYSREKNWSPNIYTVASKEIEGTIHKNLYYKLFRINDNYTIIDYGVYPQPSTLCSYDASGNYFMLDMSMLETGYSYGIKFMIIDGVKKTEYPEVFRFRME